MGGAGGDSEPAFTARVQPFYISKTPVTNLQFEAYDPDYHRPEQSVDDDGPAVGVSFERARGYCDWYTRISKKPMRLPTEIEWEYACRGGTTGACFFGDDEVGAFVQDATNSHGRLIPVQRQRPNPFGLHGMLGGVWEWTSSLYRPYPADDGDGRDDPTAPGPRVLRGGSYRTPRDDLGCAVRRAESPDLAGDDFGFRIARSL